DNLGLWSLDCSQNCLPAFSLEALTFLDKDQSDFSGQQILLPKNLTSLNLKTEFPQIILNQVKKNSSPDGIVFNSTTGELTEIKPNSTFIYYYGVNRNDPDLIMDVTLSFTGEEDLTLIPPEEPVSKPEPLPPFTGGNTPTKDDSDLTVEIKEIPMHRLYNPNTGEHLYTADTNERNTLTKIGWNSEGIGWIAPEISSIPVYRLYNPITEGGDHHYTMDIKERDTLRVLGWKYEDVGWYSVNEKDRNAVPLYRQYNPNQYAANHNYTVDRNEHVTLIGLGWKDEGTAWYGLKSS
ncbi:MAG: hypothetical protein K2H85_01575, partial [Allobaculum sp.]|nr:hypothetical protein [Allobaculum sp.]